MAAVNDQPAAKTFRTTERNPDMFVSYHAAISEEAKYNTTSLGVGYGPISFCPTDTQVPSSRSIV